MAELIFILTTLYVAYVVFVVVDGEKKLGIDPEPKADNSAPKTVAEVKTKAASQQTAAVKPSASASPPVKTVSSNAAKEIDSIKNPETGEVVKVPNNYRFAKRWIKQALVSEGLLDKIYKATELNDETTAKIQQAIDQLKIMTKYQ